MGDIFILLGSDLEEIGDSRAGWSVIVNSKSRPLRIMQVAILACFLSSS
jgi:hypothetical protein